MESVQGKLLGYCRADLSRYAVEWDTKKPKKASIFELTPYRAGSQASLLLTEASACCSAL